jgi:hypothetical protein
VVLTTEKATHNPVSLCEHASLTTSKTWKKNSSTTGKTVKLTRKRKTKILDVLDDWRRALNTGGINKLQLKFTEKWTPMRFSLFAD